MFPIEEFARRFEGLLDELDACAVDAALPAADAEALDELNAELEDALMLLSGIRADDADWREQLSDALEELDALAADYLALAKRAPSLGAPAERLRMAVCLAADNLEA